MSKPLILISNDDGITSKGIRVLVETMKRLGDVVVVLVGGRHAVITVGRIFVDVAGLGVKIILTDSAAVAKG